MGLLIVRCFWVALYAILWLLYGRNVFLTLVLLHTVFMPLCVLYSKKVRYYFIFIPFAWPFLRHDNPSRFGLDGARNINFRFKSKVDNCTINLGAWHVLPQSLVNKNRCTLDNGSKEEINELFDNELRNSYHPVILYCHGVMATRAAPYRVTLYKALQKLDCHVLTFDYRGFGDSTPVSLVKISAVEDTMNIYCWLRSLVGSTRPVYVYGHSFGTSLAQRVCSKIETYSRTLLDRTEALPLPQGIILECPFTSNSELAKEYLVGQVASWLPHLSLVMQTIMSSSENYFNLIAYAELLKPYPILILHSTDDTIVPFHFGKELYERHLEVRSKGDPPVFLKTFANEGHFNIPAHPAMSDAIRDFISGQKQNPSG